MRYEMPKSIDELVDALQDKDETTYLCAGGSDLVIRLREKKQFHYGLLDLTHVPELSKIQEKEDLVLIGSGVTMVALEESLLIQRECKALAKAASMVGSAQIRNRATIGGNVANASQSSDLLPVLLVYDAVVITIDKTGKRNKRDLDTILEGRGKTTLTQGEVILGFEITKGNWISEFYKVGARKSVTISKINACIKVRTNGSVIEDVAVALGAVGVRATKAPKIEDAIRKQDFKMLNENVIKTAVYEQIEENIPNRESKHYKKSAAFGVIMSILEMLKQDNSEVLV